MEIAIKDNKRNWQIVKDNRRYLFPPKIRLAFKICILVYAVLRKRKAGIGKLF